MQERVNDNTASPIVSEADIERFNSSGLSKAKNGNIDMVENNDKGNDDYEN